MGLIGRKINKIYESVSFDPSRTKLDIDKKISRVKDVEIIHSDIQAKSNYIYEYMCYVYINDIPDTPDSKEQVKVPFRKIKEKLENNLSFEIEFHIVFDAKKAGKPKAGKRVIRIKYTIHTDREAGEFELDFEDDEPKGDIKQEPKTEERPEWKKRYLGWGRTYDEWMIKQKERIEKEASDTKYREFCDYLEEIMDLEAISDIEDILNEYDNEDIDRDEMIESITSICEDNYDLDGDTTENILGFFENESDRNLKNLLDYIQGNY